MTNEAHVEVAAGDEHLLLRFPGSKVLAYVGVRLDATEVEELIAGLSEARRLMNPPLEER